MMSMRQGGLRRRAIAPAALAMAALALPGGAQASVSPTAVLDGPSPDVLAVSGAALAADGTGGVVYVKREAGRAHVFVAQFRNGSFAPAVRVDVGQRYDSAWPAIAAGAGGRLTVVWAQDLGPDTDRLYGASTAAGIGGFGRPVAIDLDVNEDTGTQPAVAMAPGGATLVAYRVTTVDPRVVRDPTIPVSQQRSEIRVARAVGQHWRVLGRVNRSTALLTPEPADGNGPQLRVADNGDAVVSWIEDDDQLVPQAWARRVLAGGFSPQMQLTTGTGPVDGLALDGGAFGDALVAARRGAPAGSPPGTPPSTVVRTLPPSTDLKASTPGPLIAIDADVPVQAPRAGQATDGTLSLGLATSGGIEQLDGTVLRGFGSPHGIGAGSSPVLAPGPDGAGTLAWATGDGGAIGVRQTLGAAAGDVRTATLSAPTGGRVRDLTGAGSHLGDALLTWRQGGDDASVIAAAFTDAPPAAFLLGTPSGWVRPGQATLTWDPPRDAIGGLRYTVALDGRAASPSLGATSWRPPRDELDDGSYAVQVAARDVAGQDRLSSTGRLRVDGSPPSLVVKRLSRRRVDVHVTDGARGECSGVDKATLTLAFGDDHRSEAITRLRHRFARPGRYRIVARATDKAGNRATLVRVVRIR
jgi:hypothetical protein